MDRRNGAAGEKAGGGRRCWHKGLGVVGAFAVGLQSLAGPVSGFVPITSQARGFELSLRNCAPYRRKAPLGRLPGRSPPLPYPLSVGHAPGPSRRRCRRSLGATTEEVGIDSAAGSDTGGEQGPAQGEGGARAQAPGYRIESRVGGSSVLVVNVGGRENPTDSDFSPLRVDYMERYSAAGMTAGGYNKRDGRASDKETLVSRLMDRPLRPAMHPGWQHETQLLSWVLSYDQKHSPVPLAITSASAALALSPVPLVRAVGGVTVGMDEAGEMIINPVMEEIAASRLNLTLAGTTEGVLMIEGEGKFVREEDMMRAIEAGHAAVKVLCEGIQEWSASVGKEQVTDTLRVQPEGLMEAIEATFTTQVDEALFSEGMSKGLQSAAMSALAKEVRASLAVPKGEEPDPASRRYSSSDVEVALKKLYRKRMRMLVKERGVRCDGRRVDEVRPIGIEPSLLPRTHGSCLFTRGDTQAIATVTLGGSGSSQKTDGIMGTLLKNFYLQYTFPPSCVGETGRNGGPPGRREIGHGALAERALSYSMPDEVAFPYSVRVESLITESSGSSSMASVCGGSLAMMDAGIPVTTPIAGVAMGLLLDEDGLGGEEAVILTDILGVEDALGTMDFKVAGNEDGITTFQLDIKCEGLTTALLGRALTQARAGRLHILEEMKKAFPDGPREELSPWVPQATTMYIEPDQIGKVIGPGGKTINKIIEDFELDAMDVGDDGRIFLSAVDREKARKAKRFVTEMLNDFNMVKKANGGKGGPPSREDFNASELIGMTFRDCEVKNIHSFGCFVELEPGIEGLVHISELDVGRVVTAEGFLTNRPKIDVKAIGLNEKGKIRLSRRQVVLDDRKAADSKGVKSRQSGGSSQGSSAAVNEGSTAAVRGP